MKSLIVLLTTAIIVSLANNGIAEEHICPIETIQPKDFIYLFNKIEGLSENLLSQHYKLYLGYVKKLNEINQKLKSVDKKNANATYSKYRALSSAQSFANNGVILHELYFSNLAPEKTYLSNILMMYIKRDFGSVENYLDDLRANGKSSRAGWVITAYNPRDKKIHNYVIDLHDLHLSAGIKPILVMDMWEHAYAIDYGIDKNTYITVFLNNVDWNEVSKRLESAIGKDNEK